MNNPTQSALLGFFCTLGLFFLCLFFVAGVKIIFLRLKDKFFPKKPKPIEPPTPTVVKRQIRKPRTIPKPVRSIEIDPEQVDRIYVKKTS